MKPMNKWTRIRGFEKVIQNLNREVLLIEGRTPAGMLRVVKEVYREMESKDGSLIPIKTGALRLSYTNDPPYRRLGKVGIRFGFGANYAVFVHEMVDPGINWSRPGSGPHFFKKAIQRSKHNILQILHDAAKVNNKKR